VQLEREGDVIEDKEKTPATAKGKKPTPRMVLSDIEDINEGMDAGQRAQVENRLGPVKVPEIEPEPDREAALLERTGASYPNRNSQQGSPAGRKPRAGQGGFVPAAPRRRRKTEERVELFISGPRPVMEAFIAFKETEGYVAYWDALQDLMTRAGVFEDMLKLTAEKAEDGN